MELPVSVFFSSARSAGTSLGRSTMAPRRSSPDAAEALDGLTRQQLLSIYRAFDRAAEGGVRGSKGTGREADHGLERDDEVDGGGGFVSDVGEGFMPEQGGGFMPEEGGGFVPEEGGGGGFLPDDAGPSDTAPSAPTPAKASTRRARSIPLRLVPRALKLLSLPSGDPEVLEIFDDVASSGSEASDSEDEGREARARRKGKGVAGEEREKRVGRTEFARVCAVLMQDAYGAGGDEDEEMDDAEEEEEDDDDDAFEDEGDSAGSDYVGPGSSPADRRTTRALARASGTTPATQPIQDSEMGSAKKKKSQGKGRAKTKGEIGSEGRQSVKHTFALFFGDGGMVDPLTGAELDVSSRTLGFDELRRAADVLGEKMTDDEIKEMLSFASSTGDSRVGLDAFERVMLDVRAV